MAEGEQQELDPAVSTQALEPAGRGLVRYDPFRRYVAEVSKFPPLTREAEVELARRYRDTGDRQALFRLVSANLMLVVRTALSFRRAARNLLDLIQEGNIGLMQALERFDPELGVRLPTYAAHWIRAYMVKYLLDNVRLVRVGTTNARRKLLRHLRREKQRLEQAGFEVGPRLLAEHFDVSEQDVKDVQAALESRDVSLDAPLGQDDTRPRSELMADARASVEDDVARHELQARTEAALGRFRVGLSARERVLLDERILADDPKTLQALGDRFGTTREAVRQAEARLMQRLREFVRRELGDLARVRIGPD
ncbi:MAG TPA: sigma-70 family RNA polymerase sigma factor [Candidatus Polarisedimenticolaceae bacterium]|nr:sigma-70 family RNA polymerase sigma factor [Candidatus Polarisedimenticolaceae bacterium]